MKVWFRKRKSKRAPLEIRAFDKAKYHMARLEQIVSDAKASNDPERITAATVKANRILRHMHRIRVVQARSAAR